MYSGVQRLYWNNQCCSSVIRLWCWPICLTRSHQLCAGVIWEPCQHFPIPRQHVLSTSSRRWQRPWLQHHDTSRGFGACQSALPGPPLHRQGPVQAHPLHIGAVPPTCPPPSAQHLQSPQSQPHTAAHTLVPVHTHPRTDLPHIRCWLPCARSHQFKRPTQRDCQCAGTHGGLSLRGTYTNIFVQVHKVESLWETPVC